MGAWEGDARVVDVKVTLQPGQVLELDPAQAQAATFTIGALPADVRQHFGIPMMGDEDFEVVSVTPDGAAYVVNMFAVHPEMTSTRAWLWWYPDQPGWCHGEVLTCASDQDQPHMIGTIPADFTLTLGTAHVVIPGAVPGAPLLPAGETLADGQVRAFPFVAIWPQHLLDSIKAAANARDVPYQSLIKVWLQEKLHSH